MKRILFLLTVATLLTSSAALADKRYAIDAVRIHASIDSTGGVWINESRTYTYEGRFTFATYELSTKGIPEISSISVGEGDQQFAEINSGNDEDQPGTFRVERKAETVVIRWNYEAKDETRTFDLRFYLKGVAVAHADIAEFYYKFVGTGWDRQAGNVEVTVQLPAAVPMDAMKVWAHGPLHGTCAILAPGLARFEVTPLPKRTFWEGRIIFPREFLSAAFSRTDRTALPKILEEERAWAEEANRVREGAIRDIEERRAWQEQNLPWLIAVNVGGLFMLFYLYNRSGRSLIAGKRRIEPSPPNDMPPALANYYYAGSQLSGGALVSTVLDLARRGFLSIREEIKETGFLMWRWKKHDYILQFNRTKIDDSSARLRVHERELIAYLQNEIAQGAESFPFSALAKSQRKFVKWFHQWRKLIRQMVEGKKYFDPESVRAAVRCSVGMLALIGLGVFATIKMGEAGIPFIFSGAALAGLSFVIIRYSPETAAQRGRLLGFRDYLSRLAKNQSGISFDLQHLEPTLIYAMAVDFPSRALKKLLQQVELRFGTMNYPWYIYAANGHGQGGFADAMSGMMTTVSTTISSASGAGGGASGGGGGGAGGSGGGAG